MVQIKGLLVNERAQARRREALRNTDWVASVRGLDQNFPMDAAAAQFPANFDLLHGGEEFVRGKSVEACTASADLRLYLEAVEGARWQAMGSKPSWPRKVSII